MTEDALRALHAIEDGLTTVTLHDVPRDKVAEVVFALIVPVLTHNGRVVGTGGAPLDFWSGTFIARLTTPFAPSFSYGIL